MNKILYLAFAEAKRVLAKIFHLLLSHHPICKAYRPDMFKVGRVHFCKGCFMGYSFSISLVIAYFLILPLVGARINLSAELMIPVGVILGLTQLARAFILGLPSWWKTVQKLMLGAGIASIIIGIYGLPLELGARILILIGCFLVYGILGASLRFHYLKKTCAECEYEGDWESCEGLSHLFEMNERA